LLHGEDDVGDWLGEMGLVGGKDDGAGTGTGVFIAGDWSDGPGSEVGEEFDHVVGGGYVEIGEWLVEEQEFGVGLKDAGEGGALAHALGVVADGAGEVGIESDGAKCHLW
jgi:hypothetical protein